MDMVRTTISLPRQMHEQLRIESVKKGMALGELVTRKLKNCAGIGFGEEQAVEDLEFFKKMAKSSRKYDAVKAVREERERDE